jgi:F-type H+-transporting ATPase subunit a
MISDTAGTKAKPYFPFIFSLFMFVLFCNMLGMLPYSFTVTSHIIVTLIMAIFIFVAVTIIGFLKHGFGYLKLFVHSGVTMPEKGVSQLVAVDLEKAEELVA